MFPEWSKPYMAVSFGVLNIYCWYLGKKMQRVMRITPLLVQGMGARGKAALFCWRASRFWWGQIHCSRDKAEPRILQSAVEVALQSVIVCHAPVMPFVTYPSTRLSNDSVLIDIPNGHRRGRLVAILQKSVKNSNSATRLGRKDGRHLTENC